MKTDFSLFERYVRPMAPLSTGLTPDLSRLEPFAAVLFDVYGTLLVSEAGELDQDLSINVPDPALQQLIAAYGISRTPGELVQALHQAVVRDHAMQRSRGVDYPEVDILKIWQQVLHRHRRDAVREFALAWELLVHPVDAMPGLRQTLDHLCNRRIPMGIISNAQFYTALQLRWILALPLDRAGILPDLIFLSFRNKSAKPSIAMFLAAAAELARRGLEPADALYLGNDMRNDIIPADTVGFKTALFAGDRRSLRLHSDDPNCRSVAPDAVLTDLRQLIRSNRG